MWITSRLNSLSRSPPGQRERKRQSDGGLKGFEGGGGGERGIPGRGRWPSDPGLGNDVKQDPQGGRDQTWRCLVVQNGWNSFFIF